MEPFIARFCGLPGDSDTAPDPRLSAQQVFAQAMRQMPGPFVLPIPPDLDTATAWVRAWVQVIFHPLWDSFPFDLQMEVLDRLAFARLGRYAYSGDVQDYEQGQLAWKSLCRGLPEHIGVRESYRLLIAVGQQPQQIITLLTRVSADRRKRPLI